MAYSAPPNFTTGQVVTESDMDTLSDDISFLASPPRCRIYNSAAISVANASVQALTFNSETFDTDTMHSTAVNTSRITFTTAGTYLVGGGIAFAAAAGGTRRAGIIRLGGATVLKQAEIRPSVGTTYVPVPSELYSFTAGQYVELCAYQDSGAALDVDPSAGGYSPVFWATLIAVA